MDLNDLAPEARRSIEEMLRDGLKIKAIKRVRQETGAGLKEAKDAVEAYTAAQGIETPASSSGCLVVLVLLGAGTSLALALV